MNLFNKSTKQTFVPEKNAETFRTAFLEQINGAAKAGSLYESDFSDIALSELAKDVGAQLTVERIKQIIYGMERHLGQEFKIRLQRKSGWGYVVQRADEQAEFIHRNAGKRAASLAKLTVKRLGYVNENLLSPEMAKQHELRTRTWQGAAGLLQLGLVKTQQLSDVHTTIFRSAKTALLEAAKEVSNMHSKKKS